ncbi:MAG: hypothetical protein IPJ94_01730 [Chloroflexi bacterium]|nr:hypothetical protein [Chloroflexota bacterium]
MYLKTITWKSRFQSLCLVITLLGTLWGAPTLVLAASGADGDRTIASGSVIINRYAPVTAINGNTITVADITALNDTVDNHYANDVLAADDLLLIYQAKGAVFTDSTDFPTYGAFDYGKAGTYEFAVVTAVSGNDITVSSTTTTAYACSGISGIYDTINGNVQVVRVPQYNNLTIQNGATVTAAPWNGQTGGIVALHVRYNLVVDGTIDVSGLGFRGGTPADHSNVIRDAIQYTTTDLTQGGEKGESILGNLAVLDLVTGRYGRGAPANGGGGGNAHNSGGGGGANGFSSGVWKTGHGFVDSGDTYASAWHLDNGATPPGNSVPTYFQGGAGGGRGGYSFSDAYRDPTSDQLNNSVWNDPHGDSRRQVGGLGGRPLDNNANTRIFFGGGGGGGDGNNSSASAGGAGGGLVILIADNTSGSGSILANGQTALDTANSFDDGAGGGGGGGTIVFKTTLLSSNTLTLTANGGNGGNQPLVIFLGLPYPQDAMGPGGGGGGGYLAVAAGSGSLLTSTVDGGLNGITLSKAMNGGLTDTTPIFPPNGATQGYPGGTSIILNNANAITFPGCQGPTAVTLQAFTVTGSSSLPIIGLGLIGLLMTFTWNQRRRIVHSQTA